MRLLKIILLGILCSYANSIKAQSPYSFSWSKEAIILGVGAATLGTGSLIKLHIEPFTEASIFSMNRSQVFDFDLPATYNISTSASSVSDYLVAGSFLTPLLLLPAQKTRQHFGQIALLYTETMLLTTGVTTLTKRLVKRPRPYVFNEQADFSDKLGLSARFSFFSGHTSIAAAGCFFTASVFEDFFPDSKLKPYVWGAAMTIPALTGYLRVAAGKHYASDVITGYVVGGLIGFLIPKWHKGNRLKHRNLSVLPSADRLVVHLQF